MELHQAQQNIALDPHRFRVLCCGRRFGKTTLAIDQMKARAVASPSRIAYVAPTLQQARDIAWEQLKRDCAQAAISIREAPMLEIRLPTQKGGESLIVLRGWEAVETLRGQYFDLVVIDEVAQMRNFWANWQEVIRPTLTDRKGEAIFISTPRGFNHFYELYSKDPTQPMVLGVEKDTDFKSFHFTSYDNPHMPEDEIRKAQKELPEDRFAQEYLADFRKTEGLVYKEFDRDKHTYSDDEYAEPIRSVKVMTGVDFGTHSIGCVLTVKEDNDNVFWVDDEFYKTGKTDAEIADLTASIKQHECYPDPESASGVEELKRRGVNVREVNKGKDSVRNGINVVRELFKQGRLMINRDRCPNLIWELETYSYPEKKPLHNEDENPIKENDHACDALRYVLMMAQKSYPQSISVFRPSYKGYRR